MDSGRRIPSMRKRLFRLLQTGAVTVFLLLLLDDWTPLIDYLDSGVVALNSRLLRASARDEGRRHLFKFGKTIGTAKVDFYRTYAEHDLFGLKIRKHSISKLKVKIQLRALNAWYSGRILFELGDILDFDDPDMHETDQSCEKMKEWARGNDVKNLDRISVIYIKTQGGVTSNCENSGFFVPLGSGGTNGTTIAPAVVVGMRYPYGIMGLYGLPTLFGGTLAMRIGHVIGFQHTAFRSFFKTVHSFNECGTEVRYPEFTSQLDNEEVFDAVTNETYYHSEWKGRTNLMAPFGTGHILHLWEMGLYVHKYAESFEAITQCWFDSAIPTP